MVFNSYTFIVFFAGVLLLHRMPFSWTVKKLNLLLASYLFYAVWNPPFVMLLWISTAVDFLAGRALYAQENAWKRKLILMVSLVANLGLLGFFKYGGFLLDNFISFLSILGIQYQPPAMDIILPVGISFYTFQTLSYTLDVYRRKIIPEKSLLDFSLFVTFFPQLVAGPIVRPDELIPQFKKPVQATQSQLIWGLCLLSLGLFMKVGLADGQLAGPADSVFGAKQPLLPLDAWMGVLAFSLQIFCDFGGYSTCAIGIALCLGFTMPDNFRYPYAAIGFSDFWQRWHITLSSWLRDYLYIPLGGNRKGNLRTYLNLMITMLLGGLWHGAAWTFVVWGALHGIFLCIERLIKDYLNRPGRITTQPVMAGKVVSKAAFLPGILSNKTFVHFSLAMLTFFLVNVTWVFFRAPDFATASRLLMSMFSITTKGIPVLPMLDILKVSLLTLLILACHWFLRNSSLASVASRTPWWLLSLVWTTILILLILTQKSTSSFIYFQF